MPRGVARDFLDILDDEQVTGKRRAIVLLVVAVLLAVPAWFLLAPWGLAVHGAALGLGLLAGFLVARTIYDGRYQSGIATDWKVWMTASLGSESIAEVGAKARGRSRRNLPVYWAALLTLLWAAEIALLVLAFEDVEHLASAVPVIALNGLLLGGALAYALRSAAWCATFRESLDEMIRDGEVGVWGVE